MRARAAANRLAALALIALTAACARAVVVGADPATTSAIEVANETGTDMIIEYVAADGGARATLGAITPGTIQRFIITLPPGTVIHVSGRSEAGRTAGPYAVTLVAGSTQRVTLR